MWTGILRPWGSLSLGAAVHNEHYGTEEEYMMAVAEACREEYKAITDADLIVQVDEPEFCTTWTFYPDWTVDELRKYLSFSVEVIITPSRSCPKTSSDSTPSGAAATARTQMTSNSSTSPI